MQDCKKRDCEVGECRDCRLTRHQLRNAATAPQKESTDPSLWTTRPAFGAAGGPEEVVLTEEGKDRAFSVGAGVGGSAALVLRELHALGEGEGIYVSVRRGSRLFLTDYGRRFGGITLGFLSRVKYLEYFYDANGDGVTLTPAGLAAIERGYAEEARLLERCRRAAGATT